MSIHREHRAAFQARLDELGAAAVIPTNTVKVRNHDADFRFRPSSDFWYLTGFGEPEAWLVLLPAEGPETPGRSILFLRERDKDLEIWNGRRLGVERAPEALGVDEARDVELLWDDLPDLLEGQARVCVPTGVEPSHDARVLEVLAGLRRRARGSTAPPVEILDPLPILHELRLFKRPGELELMRRAAAVTAEAHLAVMAAAAPGVNERELDALLDYTFRRRGGNGQAYNNIVAGGVNACILHYTENDQVLRDGDLCLVDAGCEWQHYAADVTRTFPVNGVFSPEQRAIYEVVLAAQLAAVEAVRPGITKADVHDLALGKVIDGLIDLGLLEGTRERVLESGDFRRFMMHGTSHWLGLDVHDCGAASVDGVPRPLEPGMVITVEPGVYVAEDDEQVEPRWRGIGVRIEDDVLVTADGHENLTAAIPKDPEAVEAACGARPALTR